VPRKALLGEQYVFDGFRLDPHRAIITQGGERVPLTPRAVQTLTELIENSGLVVSKDVLIERIWGTAVDENNLNQSISAIRRALGDTPKRARYIVTVPGSGYRFVGVVEVESPLLLASETATQQGETVLAVQPKPVSNSTWHGLALPAGAVLVATVLTIAFTVGRWNNSKSNPKRGLEISESSVRLADANRLRVVGDAVRALEMANEAVALEPDSWQARLTRTQALKNLGRFQEAHTEAILAQNLLMRRERRVEPLIEVQLRQLDLDYAGASKGLKKLVAEQPESMDLAIQLAWSEADAKNYEDALTTIKAARRLPGAERNPELDRVNATALGMLGENSAALNLVLQAQQKAMTVRGGSSLGRLVLLEGGLRMNLLESAAMDVVQRGRALCQVEQDEMCVAKSYRVEGNRYVDHRQYYLAMKSYRKAMPIAQRQMNFQEMERLFEGLSAAVDGINENPRQASMNQVLSSDSLYQTMFVAKR